MRKLERMFGRNGEVIWFNIQSEVMQFQFYSMEQFGFLCGFEGVWSLKGGKLYCQIEFPGSQYLESLKLYCANAGKFLNEMLVARQVLFKGQDECAGYIRHRNFVQFGSDQTVLVFISDARVEVLDLKQYNTEDFQYYHIIQNCKTKGIFIGEASSVLSMMSFLGVKGQYNQFDVALKYLQMDSDMLTGLGYESLSEIIQQRVKDIRQFTQKE